MTNQPADTPKPRRKPGAAPARRADTGQRRPRARAGDWTLGRLSTVGVGDVPAHVAIEADGYGPSIAGLTADSLLSLVAPRNEPIV